MTCKEKIIIDIEDNTRQYYLDEVTCFEKPFVVLLNDYKNKYGQYFLLFDNTNEYLIKMNLEADCLKVQFISDASTKELKMMIERLAPVEVGLMVKTWGNGGFLEVDFKESQAIISNK